MTERKGNITTPEGASKLRREVEGTEIKAEAKEGTLEIYRLFEVIREKLDALGEKHPEEAEKIEIIWQVAHKDSKICQHNVHCSNTSILNLLKHIQQKYHELFYMFLAMDVLPGGPPSKPDLGGRDEGEGLPHFIER